MVTKGCCRVLGLRYDNDKDRNRVSNDGRLLMKIMDNMMVREIMKMLTSIEKHCGVGGGA